MIGLNLGSGFGEMMKGHMTAEMGNRQQQQADQQEEQFNMMRTQFEQSQVDFKKNQAFEAVYNAERHNEWGGFPSLNEGETLRGVNDSDYMVAGPDGVKAIGGLIRNKFIEETGSALPEDNAEALKVLQRSGIISDETSGVSSFVTANQLGKGIGSGYGEFKRMKELEEAKILGKLRGKPTAAQEKEARLREYIELKALTDRTEAEDIKFNVYAKEFSMVKDNALDAALDGDFKPTKDILQADGEIDQPMINNAVKTQVKSGVGSVPEIATFNTLVAGATDLVRVNASVSDLLISEDTDAGAIQGFNASLKKMTEDKEWNNMTAEGRKSALANTIKNTQLMAKAFQIIKEESGAAFTDEEFARRIATLAGGDPAKVNSATIRAALQEFTKEKIEGAKIKLDGIDPQYIGDYSNLRNNLNKGIKGFDYQDLEALTGTGGAVSEADTISALSSQISGEAFKTGVDIVQGLLDPAKAPTPETVDKISKGATSFWDYTREKLSEWGAKEPQQTMSVEERASNPALSLSLENITLQLNDPTLEPGTRRSLANAKMIIRAAENNEQWAINVLAKHKER